MTSDPIRIVADFLQAFMSGEIDQASVMVREDFWFQAPLQEGRGTRAAYFAGAADKAGFIRAFRILRQWADGDEGSTLYELDIGTPEGQATMPVHEWHTVDAGKLVSTRMVFDSSAKAARLMANALGHR